MAVSLGHEKGIEYRRISAGRQAQVLAQRVYRQVDVAGPTRVTLGLRAPNRGLVRPVHADRFHRRFDAQAEEVEVVRVGHR